MCGSAVRIRKCSSASLGSGTARKRLSTCCSALKLRNPGKTEGATVDDGCCAGRMEARTIRQKTNGKRPNRERFMRFPVRTCETKKITPIWRAKLWGGTTGQEPPCLAEACRSRTDQGRGNSPLTGFEDRKGHRTPCASIRAFSNQHSAFSQCGKLVILTIYFD